MSIGYLKKNVKHMVFPAILVYAIMLLVLCVSCYFISINTLISYNIEIWIEGCQNMDFFLPLAVTLPFVFPFYMQRKDGFIKYASVRMNRKQYIFHQMLSGVLITVLLTTAVYYLALIFSMMLPVAVPGNSQTLLQYVFGQFQVYNPYVFGLFWCIWKGVIAGLFILFGYFLALYIDNAFIATLVPFLYCMAENLITAMLQVPKYSIMTSIVLNRLTPECMTVWNYLIGVITFICISTIIILILRKKKDEQYVTKKY